MAGRKRRAGTQSRIEHVHLRAENNTRDRMPYTPAIKVPGGTLVVVPGVTAARVYHSHVAALPTRGRSKRADARSGAGRTGRQLCG
jgi:hypothetical protein